MRRLLRVLPTSFSSLTLGAAIGVSTSTDSTHNSPSPSLPPSPSKLRYPPVPPRASFLDQAGEIQRGMKWRDGDIIISVPGKSGTTWTMNIVHQLRSGGDPNVRDIYEQVPWLEFWEYPTQPVEELYHRWDGLPTWFPRAFKSHAAPPTLPYQPNLKYVVVYRDPRDAIASCLPFLKSHSQEFFGEFKGFPRGPLNSADDLFYGIMQKGASYITFLKSWWPLRNKPNVLILHYNDMIKDHVGTIKKVQDFLEIKVTEQQFKNICEYTSFPWMKKHGDKFAMQHLLPIPVMSPEGMVRKGQSGEGCQLLSKKALEDFDQACDKELTVEQKKWLLHGGPLPK